MISFPNCKINLGLRVVRQRPDGYHDIETLMYPVRGLHDMLEIIKDTEADAPGVRFSSSGLALDCPDDRNLCVRAYGAVCGEFGALPPVKMHLHKTIPFGAGLGGGSADAAEAIRMLDALFSLGMDYGRMEHLAAKIGSDTAFFIRNAPAIARGRGELLTPSGLSLRGCHIVIVKPAVAVSTAQAYASVTPAVPAVPLEEVLLRDPRSWREALTNDFEPSVVAIHPSIGEIKDELYRRGAFYAAMSGSGSAVFGLFECKPATNCFSSNCFAYSGPLVD